MEMKNVFDLCKKWESKEILTRHEVNPGDADLIFL